MFLRGSALLKAVALRATGMAPALVAGVAKQAIRTQLIDAKTPALAQRNDEDSGIAAFVLTVLVESNVVPFILVRLQRKIVNLLSGKGA
jgi:hypothetical protein